MILKKHIPSWVIYLQLIIFIILYAVWVLPETIFIRNICLSLGALISIYEIAIFRKDICSKNRTPIWLILMLFAWVTFHLFFLSQNFDIQYHEYTSIWKRVGLGAIFALGFGLAIGSQGKNIYLILILFGLFSPTLIYIIKYFLTLYGGINGLVVSDYLKLYQDSAPYYLHKTAYDCFCLPTLAAALGLIRSNLKKGNYLVWDNFLYLTFIIAILFVFSSEHIKNGVIYSFALIAIFLVWSARISLKNILFISVIIVFLGLFAREHVKENIAWKQLFSDARIAVDVNRYDQWKYSGEKGYPVNESGKVVSGTNYERIAWGVSAITLIEENPLGYGLLERSFGNLAKIKWPESKLSQSHSGWLDLTLGIGIPGVFLVLGALLCAMRNTGGATEPWRSMGLWILLSLLLMWCTTELSQKVYFDHLIFWIVFVSALGIKINNNDK